MRTGGWFELNHYLDDCGYLCAATGRPAEALTMWSASAALLGPADLRLRDLPLRAARQALGAGRTRAAEERGAAMSLAVAAEYALMLTAPGPAQPGGTGPGPGPVPGRPSWSPRRPGPDQRPDRRPAVHKRPHSRLAPGPDPGQDRLPPPRRPDPPGPDHGPGLARPASRPGTPGRRATRSAERPDPHPLPMNAIVVRRSMLVVSAGRGSSRSDEVGCWAVRLLHLPALMSTAWPSKTVKMSGVATGD